MPALAIEVKNLVKRYPNAVAVDGISFTIPRGVVTALLGGGDVRRFVSGL
jgi:ABC-2 type transport system ATP-binding protein